MAEIVNLRRARKAQARGRARAKADANAVRHGLSAAERARIRSMAEQQERLLDGHLRENDDQARTDDD